MTSFHRPIIAVATAFTAAILISPSALAGVAPGPGWSNDPAAPTVIADRSGEEVQAKILPRADGGFYVSWFDNTDGGYDVRLQRLDADGRTLWGDDGILVADRGFSWTTDYGFAVDSQGNAVLSFQCCAQGGPDEHLVVSLIDADGQALWGVPGLPVTDPGDAATVSRAGATGDGGVVVAWTGGDGVARAQKFDVDGDALWASGGIVIPGPAGASHFLADIQPGTDGDAIVSWSNQPSLFTNVLYAQKLGAEDGAPLWGGEGVRVSDSGNLQIGYFPPFLPDGDGGAVFAYYDITGVSFDIRVQHIDSDGVRRFGDHGVLATLDTSRDHVSPAGTFDPVTGDIVVAWVDDEIIDMQAYHSLYVQRIDAEGERRWGDDGVQLVPPAIATTGENALSQPVVLAAPDSAIVAWSTGNPSVTSHPIRAQRLDLDGEAMWAAPALLKTLATQTSRLAGATSTDGYAAFVWSDAPGLDPAGNDVLGQKLQYSGFLGDTVFAHDFEAVD